MIVQRGGCTALALETISGDVWEWKIWNYGNETKGTCLCIRLRIVPRFSSEATGCNLLGRGLGEEKYHSSIYSLNRYFGHLLWTVVSNTRSLTMRQNTS